MSGINSEIVERDILIWYCTKISGNKMVNANCNKQIVLYEEQMIQDKYTK